MKPVMQSVYIICNRINGKKYVGRSATPKYRIKIHFNGLKSGYHKNEMMLEDSFTYGYESFDFYIFGTYEKQEASRMEVFLMKILRTQDPRFGYNYKDRSGSTKYAIADKWRTPPQAWDRIFRSTFFKSKTDWRVNRLPYHESEPIVERRFH